MKIFNYTITALLIITIITAFFSGINHHWSQWAILILSGIKFILVSFNFMEMRKAHPLWRGLLIGFIGIFILVFGLLT
jgi:hypothetical protein